MILSLKLWTMFMILMHFTAMDLALQTSVSNWKWLLPTMDNTRCTWFKLFCYNWPKCSRHFQVCFGWHPVEQMYRGIYTFFYMCHILHLCFFIIFKNERLWQWGLTLIHGFSFLKAVDKKGNENSYSICQNASCP